MKTYKVYANYDASTVGSLSLPEGIEWDDIKEWYIKWDVFHYTVDGNTWAESALDSDTLDVVDWKRPSSVSIYGTNAEGEETGELVDED